jgi:hypothetical protein
MAISTYAELQTAAMSFMGREGDTALAAVVDEAIAMAEAKFNRTLRVSQMEDTESVTLTDGVGTLPSDFLSARRVVDTYGSSDAVLEYATPEWCAQTYPTSPAGYAAHYTIIGGSLYVFPLSSGPITLNYYAKVPALSASNTTNWLLTAHPDLYLQQTLVELNAFAKQPDAAALWSERAVATMQEVMALDKEKRYARSVARLKGGRLWP